MDLCRIYTSGTIAENFEHLAEAMVELRQEFDKLAQLKLTPTQYALRMLKPKMSLTSPLKMKNSDIQKDLIIMESYNKQDFLI